MQEMIGGTYSLDAFLDIVRGVARGNGEGVHYELVGKDGAILYQAPLAWPDDASDNFFAWRISIPEQLRMHWPFTTVRLVIDEGGFSFSISIPENMSLSGEDVVITISNESPNACSVAHRNLFGMAPNFTIVNDLFPENG